MNDPEKATQQESFLKGVHKRLGDSLKSEGSEDFQAHFPDYGDLFEEDNEAVEPLEPKVDDFT
jgi:hypothetical protein